MALPALLRDWPVARALVEAPETWTPQPAKIKTPYDFIVSTHRALGTRPQRIQPLRQALLDMLTDNQELADLDESTLGAALKEAGDGAVAELPAGGADGILDLLVASGLVASRGAAKRTLAEGGVYVNNVRIESDEWIPQASDFLHDRWLVLRRGKRNIAGVVRVAAGS